MLQTLVSKFGAEPFIIEKIVYSILSQGENRSLFLSLLAKAFPVVLFEEHHNINGIIRFIY